MIVLILIVLGLCFGSFVNATVWRIHEQKALKQKPKRGSKKPALTAKELSISKGRSMCTHCHHVLAAKDLIPVLSWVELRGKCRYCGKRIEDTPLAELLTPLLFVISYLWWPTTFTTMQTVNFVMWCVALVGFVALMIYDIRWLTLPNRIVYPLTVLAAGVAILNITVFHGGMSSLKDIGFAVLIDAGLFYGLFQLSKGKWIGGGDVKLGLLLGLLIAAPIPAFLVLFFASLIGTVLILPGLITKKVTAKSHIPFGPFLIIATIIVRLFGAGIVAWYKKKFLLY
ncbi:MAG: putative Prepilin peptidase [Candidatus Saccharibacteria bacterium]|nr:putative Prepilin peptidase [Candidatus Saccharibacteria bacterium]